MNATTGMGSWGLRNDCWVGFRCRDCLDTAGYAEKLAAQGEVRGDEYALMYDRLALQEGRPQRYGSQMTCKAGKYVPDRLEDPANIDGRRATLGMRPYKDYLAMFANDPPC